MSEPNPPFIAESNRPDLTVIAGGSGGEQPRDVGAVLASPAKPIEKAIPKETLKEIFKDHKDFKDFKDNKEHKDLKDHKDPKEHKDQKDPKDHKDQKDHKEQKDHKDFKDHIEKAIHIEKAPQIETVGPVLPKPGEPVEGGGVGGVVERTSGLMPGKP
jgi:hypothetical protein